jgi:Tfp pilus assembly protein PilX
MRHSSSTRHGGQRGMALLLVLVLLSIMILGGLALARLSAGGTFIAGNAASRQGSLQASEVGVNSAFAAVQGLGNDDVAVTGWYFPVTQAVDSAGVCHKVSTGARRRASAWIPTRCATWSNACVLSRRSAMRTTIV